MPSHPYTHGLFDSVPELDCDVTGRLAVIPGLPPDPTNLPVGCRFSPRCPKAQPICHEEAQGMKEIRPGHFVNCHFPIMEARSDR
jgi:peptide/nickel transport system ATP-binding protein